MTSNITPEMIARAKSHITRNDPATPSQADEGVQTDSPPVTQDEPVAVESQRRGEETPEPAQSQEPAQTAEEDPRVPKARLDEVLAKSKKHREETERVRKELEALKAEKAKAEREQAMRAAVNETPSNWDEMSEQERMAHVAEKLNVAMYNPDQALEMERAAFEWRVAEQMDVSPRQAKVLADVISNNRELSQDEAMLIAKARDPELFPDSEPAPRQTEAPRMEPSHQSVRPQSTRGTQPIEPEPSLRDLPEGEARMRAAAARYLARQ